MDGLAILAESSNRTHRRLTGKGGWGASEFRVIHETRSACRRRISGSSERDLAPFEVAITLKCRTSKPFLAPPPMFQPGGPDRFGGTPSEAFSTVHLGSIRSPPTP